MAELLTLKEEPSDEDEATSLVRSLIQMTSMLAPGAALEDDTSPEDEEILGAMSERASKIDPDEMPEDMFKRDMIEMITLGKMQLATYKKTGLSDEDLQAAHDAAIAAFIATLNA